MNLGFFVPGDPRPKGSMRSFGNGRMGHVNADTLLEWMARVVRATHAATDIRGADGPIGVRVRFNLRRPKSHYGRNGKLRPDAARFHGQRPDIDKLARALLDALTESNLWIDDGQVARLDCTKSYDAEPGAHVWIESL